MTDSNVSRTSKRRLLEAAGGVALIAAVGGGTVALSGPTQARLRPPGSVREADFLAKCLRCDRCRSVCPQHVIRSGDFADGLASLRTPLLTFQTGYCDFCDKCIAVCPTGALLPVPSDKKAVLGLAEITDNCIALRTGACSKCVKNCPEDAIHLNAAKIPVIDAARCNGCGKCEATCPANVIQSYRGGERGIVVRPLKSEDN